MLYQNRSFTCPAAGSHTPDIKWDLAFLPAKEFFVKYGLWPKECTAEILNLFIIVRKTGSR